MCPYEKPTKVTKHTRARFGRALVSVYCQCCHHIPQRTLLKVVATMQTKYGCSAVVAAMAPAPATSPNCTRGLVSRSQGVERDANPAKQTLSFRTLRERGQDPQKKRTTSSYSVLLQQNACSLHPRKSRCWNAQKRSSGPQKL